jgi:hypothetical protein
MSIVLDTPEGIAFFKVAQLRYAIEAEGRGLRHSSGRSVLAFAKKYYGIKGNRESVIAQLDTMMEEMMEAKRRGKD